MSLKCKTCGCVAEDFWTGINSKGIRVCRDCVNVVVVKRRLTRKALVKFLEDNTGEKEGERFRVMTGKEGKKYCEYSGGLWYVSFEESVMYDYMQGYPNWNFHTKLHTFLEQFDLYPEQGHSWNLSIYK